MKLEYINIIDAIQYAVDKITKQEYKNDDCPPKFIVSQYDKFDTKGKIVGHEIVLTVDHLDFKHTRPLFPRLEFNCGYESLKDEMRYLYNSTM